MMGVYPGRVNQTGGTLVLETVGGSLLIYGLLTGLATNSVGLLKLHTGYSCEGPDRVGGASTAPAWADV